MDWQAVGVSSRSAEVASERPFYALHADAYDALVTDPVEPWVAAVHDELIAAGLRQARVLDAGCGTGRHAEALAERGHEVALLDASAELLTIARSRCASSASYLGDICDFSVDDRFDAITCRGVLNDLVTDEERVSALAALAEALVPNGMLIIDVREAKHSEARTDGRTRRAEVENTTGGRLSFRSTPRWSAGLIEVEETYELVDPAGASSTHQYAFQMRPWTREELQTKLRRAGLDRVEIRPGIGRRTTDRLLVVARKAP